MYRGVFPDIQGTAGLIVKGYMAGRYRREAGAKNSVGG